ncbi:unnamed protein product [Darwinula stevensoni]|uniref:Protein N-terminal glutamine amidohydrolase n=1 Tax=Darwinula stevensoni TaxID=69355 RepID=A0A7R9A6C7_9CRUS|nr:unnamed protein product [Darwinula stevensoni]CAG0887391.1 unnamed protein product [Darwinula stevensoni]
MHLHCPDALQNAFVVFVSNEKRAVPLWRQRAGRTEDKLVIWDYHVVLLHSHDGRYLVYDLDSDLPFPTYFHKYVTETFRTDHILKPEYHRCFRVIPGISFLQDFSSDRSHMKKDGVWIKSPPEYPPIFEPERGNNLEEFISMNPGIPRGEILSLPDLVKKFHSFTTS